VNFHVTTCKDCGKIMLCGKVKCGPENQQCYICQALQREDEAVQK